MATENVKVGLAKLISYKNMDYETFCYSDYASNITAEEIDEVWDYVVEMEEIGTIAFNEKYKNN